MRYTMLLGKIHRATVTEANKDYEGSITIDKDLLEASGIIQWSQVQIYNITNGERFETYAIEGKSGSGQVIINGAAAHKALPGDLIIVASYGQMDAAKARRHHPSLAYVDARNALVKVNRG